MSRVVGVSLVQQNSPHSLENFFAPDCPCGRSQIFQSVSKIWSSTAISWNALYKIQFSRKNHISQALFDKNLVGVDGELENPETKIL